MAISALFLFTRKTSSERTGTRMIPPHKCPPFRFTKFHISTIPPPAAASCSAQPPTSPRRLLVALFLLAAAASPSVAVKIHWAPNVNYTEWADRREFHVGDWLDFRYEKDRYDVVQVNETAYAKCDGSDPILSYSRGHNFPFELNRTGRFYFICSRGYCWNGMKVSVLVQPKPLPPAMAPSSHASRAAAGVWLWAALAALVGAALLGQLPFRAGPS